MSSTYSTNLKIELMGTGDQSGTWGTTTNTNLGTALEQAIVGKADIAMSSTTVTLTLTNTNALQDARAVYLNLSGTPGGAADLIVPAIQKPYIVKNGSNQQVTIKVTGQTGVAIPAGKTTLVYNNGTDVVTSVDYIPALALGTPLAAASGGTGGTSGAVPPGAVTTSGLTMATAKVLGRTTASTGAIEELSASGLRLSSGSLIGSPIGGASSNLKGNTASNASVNITCDRLILLDTSGTPFIASSVSVTPDITVSGANGLDTGSEASSTWYYVYVIAKEDGTVAGLMSTSSSAPTMPSGYTYRALVSAVRNNGSSNFIGYYQRASKIYYIEQQSVLSGGTSTVEAAITISAQVPPAALSFVAGARLFLPQSASATAAIVADIRYASGFTFTQIIVGNTGAAGSSFSSAFAQDIVELPNLSQQLYYLLSASTGSPTFDSWITGFTLPIGE